MSDHLVRALRAPRRHSPFGNADHSGGHRKPGQLSLDHGSAFVQHQGRIVQLARAQQLHNLFRAMLATDLLVGTKGEINRAPRLVPGLEQLLDGLEDRNHGAFVVERAAAINISFADRPGKGRVTPCLFGTGENRHDIQMRHEDDRRFAAVLSRPLIQKGVLADPLTG
jgi:hypothetical protein